jgi:hypothetical protein
MVVTPLKKLRHAHTDATQQQLTPDWYQYRHHSAEQRHVENDSSLGGFASKKLLRQAAATSKPRQSRSYGIHRNYRQHHNLRRAHTMLSRY